MKRRLLMAAIGVFVAGALLGSGCGLRPARPPAGGGMAVERLPRVRPDYDSTVIPPNIAPLNFAVREPGTGYHVAIHSTNGTPVEVASRSATITIPQRPWRKLLAANRGEDLSLEVQVQRRGGEWQRFRPLTFRVAPEDIDPYLVYRRIHPAYNQFTQIGIYQRDLRTYGERAVLRNDLIGQACINCHAFRGNEPDRMTVAIRSQELGSGTVLAQDSRVGKVGTKFGYTAWHPSGQLVVFSANKVRQFFHSARAEVRDVVDLDSGLAYYDLRTQSTGTVPAISDPDRLETYPAWSPDGGTLYFSSAPIPWEDRTHVPLESYRECRYDLRRVSYDLEADAWGAPETLLSAEDAGGSLLLPRVSPDGRLLLFCRCEYGCFPIFQPSSDLYLMDLEEGTYRRLVINSPRSESWHSWSSNGRWIAFSSKRGDGIFTRTYLSYVDEAGEVHKPVLVPQQDPLLYDSMLETYTVPELLAGPVPAGMRDVAAAVASPEQVRVAEPVIFGPASVGAPAPQAAEPWSPSRPPGR